MRVISLRRRPLLKECHEYLQNIRLPAIFELHSILRMQKCSITIKDVNMGIPRCRRKLRQKSLVHVLVADIYFYEDIVVSPQLQEICVSGVELIRVFAPDAPVSAQLEHDPFILTLRN